MEGGFEDRDPTVLLSCPKHQDGHLAIHSKGAPRGGGTTWYPTKPTQHPALFRVLVPLEMNECGVCELMCVCVHVCACPRSKQ